MTKCEECRKPIIPGEAVNQWTGPAGLNMNRLHRQVTYTRHASCQEKVEKWVTEARVEAEDQRAEDLRALRASL